MTDYSSTDSAVVDAAWEGYVVNGFVALPALWTKDRKWPPGRPMPGETSKEIYVVDGFHQLHCLVSFEPPL